VSDIVERIEEALGQDTFWDTDAPPLLTDAAAEIKRLRNGAAEGCETVCPHVRGTVTQHCSLNFTLTDEERAALHWFAHYGLPEHRAATLRSLLERLQ
jgi:hypothetical protein